MATVKEGWMIVQKNEGHSLILGVYDDYQKACSDWEDLKIKEAHEWGTVAVEEHTYSNGDKYFELMDADVFYEFLSGMINVNLHSDEWNQAKKLLNK